jgi:hypothetical protein
MCLIKHQVIKMQRGMKVQLHAFLSFTTDGAVWSASHPGYFTPRESASGTPWTGGWTGLTANVDVEQEKNILPLSGIKPLAAPPYPTHYTNWAMLALLNILILPICGNSWNISIWRLHAKTLLLILGFIKFSLHSPWNKIFKYHKHWNKRQFHIFNFTKHWTQTYNFSNSNGVMYIIKYKCINQW